MWELEPRQRRLIWWNAALWTAGNTLTSGAFLSYFAHDLGASATALAVLAATPEMVGAAGLGSRAAWHATGDRRLTWLIVTLIARLTTFLIPLIGLGRGSLGTTAPWVLIGILVVAQAAQGLATTLYYSWLSDLVSPGQRGALLAGRNIVSLAVTLVLPVVAGRFRDWARHQTDPHLVWWCYCAVFCLGASLLLASVIPMWRVVHPPASPAEGTRLSLGTLRGLLRETPVRWLLAHSWCLAAANGITQAVFFKYQINELKVGLGTYSALMGVMGIIQIGTSTLAACARTAADHRRLLFWGALCASLALPFWLLATRDQWWWLIGAFVCWGAFGAVNVAGPNLMLHWSEPGDNAHHWALFRQVAGLIAGTTGILGGWWLDTWLRSRGEAGGTLPYHAIMAVSWAGRTVAAFLVLGVCIDRRPADPS